MREITEQYEGWSIVTEREPYTDLIIRKFKFGKYQWLQVSIEQNVTSKNYYIKICGSEPFKFNKPIKLRSKDYQSLCNEGNDELRALFTQTHEYLIQFINELPEI